MTEMIGCTGPTLDEEAFIQATLTFVRRCPARSDYRELFFATDEGVWRWCFPEPAEHEKPTGNGAIALTVGRHGAQAYPVTEDGDDTVGSVLPRILGGAEVRIARRLVAGGL